jgi:transcriptional regulator
LLSHTWRGIHLCSSHRRRCAGGDDGHLAGHAGADDSEDAGYGLARRIEQTSGDTLTVNYGTLYPAILKLEQEGYVSSEWGVSDNNRRAKFYKLTRAGRKQLAAEAREWERTTAIVARFFEAAGESR